MHTLHWDTGYSQEESVPHKVKKKGDTQRVCGEYNTKSG